MKIARVVLLLALGLAFRGTAGTAEALVEGDSPAISRDGRKLAFQRYENRHVHVGVLDLDSGETTWIARGETEATRVENACHPSWGPDDTLAFSYANLTNTAYQRYYGLGLRDGYRLRVWRDGAVADLAGGRSRNYSPSFTPDGRQIYFCRQEQNGGFTGIARIAADGSGAFEAVVPCPADADAGLSQPVVSPDGKRLAFAEMAGLNGIWGLKVVNLETPQEQRMLSSGAQSAYAPNWMPDGRHLVYTGFDRGDPGWGVFMMDVEDRSCRRLCDGTDPCVSPDGQWLYFANEGKVWRRRLTAADEPDAAVALPDPRADKARILHTVAGPFDVHKVGSFRFDADGLGPAVTWFVRFSFDWDGRSGNAFLFSGSVDGAGSVWVFILNGELACLGTQPGVTFRAVNASAVSAGRHTVTCVHGADGVVYGWLDDGPAAARSGASAVGPAEGTGSYNLFPNNPEGLGIEIRDIECGLGWPERPVKLRLPVTDGLLFRLDASEAPTISSDAAGRVTSWRSCACDPRRTAELGSLSFDTISGYAETYLGPHRVDSAFGDACGVRFGRDVDDTTVVATGLRSSQVTSNRTVFAAVKVLDYNRVTGWMTLWGAPEDGDFGLYNEAWYMRFRPGCAAGGFLWLDGTEKFNPASASDAVAAFEPNRTLLLGVEASAANMTDGKGVSSLVLGTYSLNWLGGNTYRRYAQVDIAEFLAYDRVLTESERRLVFAYLREKWQGGATGALWCGAGDGVSWHDRENWMPPRTPADGVSVDLRGARVRATDDVHAGTVTNGTLRIDAPGDTLLDAALVGATALEKRGAGCLTVNGPQTLTGETHLSGGTLSASSNLVFAALGGLVVHLDAARGDSLVAEGDRVREWRSLTDNGLVYQDAAVCNPDETRICDYPCRFDVDGGRPAVVFGWTPENVRTGSYMRADRPFSYQTVFFVNRQPDRGAMGGIFGVLDSTAHRIVRSNFSQNAWVRNGERDWLNGEVRYDAAVGSDRDYFGYGSENDPHLLVMRFAQPSVVSGNTLGVAWALDGAKANAMMYVNDPCILHEVVVFDRALTDEEVDRVQASLMAKWGIAPKAVVEIGLALSPQTTYALSGDAVVDFGGTDPVVKGVRLEAGRTAVYPILTLTGFSGCLGLTESDLTLESDRWVPSQTLIRTVPGTLDGPFRSVSPSRSRIAYSADEVFLLSPGALLLLR